MKSKASASGVHDRGSQTDLTSSDNDTIQTLKAVPHIEKRTSSFFEIPLIKYQDKHFVTTYDLNYFLFPQHEKSFSTLFSSLISKEERIILKKNQFEVLKKKYKDLVKKGVLKIKDKQSHRLFKITSNCGKGASCYEYQSLETIIKQQLQKESKSSLNKELEKVKDVFDTSIKWAPEMYHTIINLETAAINLLVEEKESKHKTQEVEQQTVLENINLPFNINMVELSKGNIKIDINSLELEKQENGSEKYLSVIKTLKTEMKSYLNVANRDDKDLNVFWFNKIVNSFYEISSFIDTDLKIENEEKENIFLKIYSYLSFVKINKRKYSYISSSHNNNDTRSNKRKTQEEREKRNNSKKKASKPFATMSEIKKVVPNQQYFMLSTSKKATHLEQHRMENLIEEYRTLVNNNLNKLVFSSTSKVKNDAKAIQNYKRNFLSTLQITMTKEEIEEDINLIKQNYEYLFKLRTLRGDIINVLEGLYNTTQIVETINIVIVQYKLSGSLEGYCYAYFCLKRNSFNQPKRYALFVKAITLKLARLKMLTFLFGLTMGSIKKIESNVRERRGQKLKDIFDKKHLDVKMIDVLRENHNYSVLLNYLKMNNIVSPLEFIKIKESLIGNEETDLTDELSKGLESLSLED
ncbi:hypothetical protein ABK040_007406 [Willaertia magna]